MIATGPPSQATDARLREPAGPGRLQPKLAGPVQFITRPPGHKNPPGLKLDRRARRPPGGPGPAARAAG